MADTDILTLEEAKRALPLEQTNEAKDAELQVYIGAVSGRLDDLCGPVVQRSVPDELHDGDRCSIRPRVTPVVSVAELAEWYVSTEQILSAETNATKTATDYLLENDGRHNVVIRRRANNGDLRFACGRQNVVLTYVAGRFETTEDVSDKFKQAAALMLTHLWRGEVGMGNATFGDQAPPAFHEMPLAVVKLLKSELRPPGLA